jgi:hypothetical protein
METSSVSQTAGVQPSNVEVKQEHIELSSVGSERQKDNDIQEVDTVELRVNPENRPQLEIDEIENVEDAIALSQQAAQGLSAQISGITSQSVVDILRTL